MCTVNLFKVICQLYLNKLEKRKKKWPVCCDPHCQRLWHSWQSKHRCDNQSRNRGGDKEGINKSYIIQNVLEYLNISFVLPFPQHNEHFPLKIPNLCDSATCKALLWKDFKQASIRDPFYNFFGSIKKFLRCTCVTEPLCYVPENNTILLISYTSIWQFKIFKWFLTAKSSEWGVCGSREPYKEPLNMKKYIYV